MKRFFFATVSLLLVAFSCSKIEPGTVVSPLETSSVIEVSTLPVSENSDPYFVDMDDVDKYVDFRILESLSKGKTLELKSVEPIRLYSNNNRWYSPTEDRMITIKEETDIYKYRKEMLYGFSKMQ